MGNNKFILYFKSKAFLFMVSLFLVLVGIGVAYDRLFGIVHPFKDVHTLSDLTGGDVITAVASLVFILIVIVSVVTTGLRNQ